MGIFKDTKAELKKVVWPTKKQIINNTVWVLVLVIMVAAVVLGIDLVLEVADTKIWDLIKTWIS